MMCDLQHFFEVERENGIERAFANVRAGSPMPYSLSPSKLLKMSMGEAHQFFRRKNIF